MTLDLPDWTTRVSPSPIQPVVWSAWAATGTEDGGLLVPGTAGKRIELAALMLVAEGLEGQEIRGVVICEWGFGFTPIATPVAFAAISPEKPSDFPPVPPGAMLSALGDALSFEAVVTSLGVGTQLIMVGVMYRLV